MLVPPLLLEPTLSQSAQPEQAGTEAATASTPEPREEGTISQLCRLSGKTVGELAAMGPEAVKALAEKHGFRAEYELQERVVPKPPTEEYILRSGYSPEGAKRMARDEAQRAALGIMPYGPHEETRGPNGEVAVLHRRTPRPEIPENPYLTPKGRAVPSVKEMRAAQKTLEGVKFTVRTAFMADRMMQPGEDVTEVAPTWPNLPTLLKRGMVSADPPVDVRALQLVRPPTRPAELAATKMYATDRAEIDAQRVLAARPAPQVVSREAFDPDADELVTDGDLADAQAQVAALAAAASLPARKEEEKAVAEVADTAEKAPGVAPGLSPGLLRRLKDLQVQDSAKHIKAALREAGADVPGNASKTELLAIRDGLIAS